MSIASPQNRKEFREYILTKLGKPVLQINVADEQIDLAINDAFQYFHEREHFSGTDRLYYRIRVEQPLLDFFRTAKLQEIEQSTAPQVYNSGVVTELTLVTPGSGYVPTSTKTETKTNQPTTSPNGEGLTVNWGETRTVNGGLTSVTIYGAGSGYSIGDEVVIVGGNNDCIFEVTNISTSTPLYGVDVIEQQRNWITLPNDVLGVTQVINLNNTSSIVGGGVIPPAFFTNPFLAGSAGGMGLDMGMQFDMVSWYLMKEHLETLNFLLRPPISYEFNQRTHRLHIHSNTTLKLGSYLVIECAVKPSPDVYPDIWNDMWLKKYCVALVKKQWGANLTKFTQVQLPGGITMNGEFIYNEAVKDIKDLESRFSMDFMDIPLDMVG